MKRFISLFLLVFLAACFTGCAKEGYTTKVQVCVANAGDTAVESGSVWVEPGEDAVFLLDLEPGWTLAGTDYDGEYRTQMLGDKLQLTLEAIRYPTRVRLTLTDNFRTITYEPNGGEGESMTIPYALDWHSRPNTAIGTDWYQREGYLLIGWNTEPDGSGTRIGLGSRCSVPSDGMTLYAQWERCAPESDFTVSTTGNTVTITGYLGSADVLAIPETIQGMPVTAISYGALQNSGIQHLILPKTMEQVAESAFRGSSLESVTCYDSIVRISDASFAGCAKLQTLYINAIEAPCGYENRKESCYADKVDLLIAARGTPKVVFYGGCSVWYNLDGALAAQTLGDEWTLINMGLNGTVNAFIQMQIMGAFLEAGDILVHTPELSSPQQMMLQPNMNSREGILWSGLEYNYDLLRLVDLQSISGVIDSFCNYLADKEGASDYAGHYTDSKGRSYLDATGGIPFLREETAQRLSDEVTLEPDMIDPQAMTRLEACYRAYLEQGVRVYVSYACVNMDAVPADRQENVTVMDESFRQAITQMDGPVLISSLEDFLYQNSDFYDTNYHLRTSAARRNTEVWMRDLLAQMEKDGLGGC